MHDNAFDLLAGWLKAQEVFWQGAVSTPVADAAAFAEPDWLAFDGLVEQLTKAIGGQSSDLPAAVSAVASYRRVIAQAWSRVRRDFDVHRRAIQSPGTQPDWRVLRDRWFQIAEAEFIRTQRSAPFLEAQRDVIRSVIALWAKVPESTRDAVRDARLVGQTAFDTLSKLGMDGVTIADTPKQVVWQDGRVSLSRYRPLLAEHGRLGPVVICHGLIGRQTMTDLRPDRSLVRNMLAAGVDVFVVDWGNAAPADAGDGLDRVAGDWIGQLVRQACDISGSDGIVLFGICQGGTLAASHAARFGQGLKGLILGVAPIDFHADIYDADPAHGLLNLWVRSLDDRDLDGLIAMEGNLSGPLMGAVFNQLNPVRTLAKYAIDMLEHTAPRGELLNFLAMEKWLADRPDLPGALAHTWLKHLYHRNALVKKELALSGQLVDLRAIQAPVLNIFATNDHIIPPPCSRALAQYVSGPYQELALPSGHIGAFVGARSQTLLAPAIVAWLSTLS